MSDTSLPTPSARRTAGPFPRRAFTLVELLVVIGIIALMIGILIPVVSSVRKQAWNTSTSNEISTIVAAIDSYYGDFKAYPGPIGEANLIDATNGTTPICTCCQNLVFGLEGGWEPVYGTSGATNGSFKSAVVGTGAMSFNGVASASVGNASESTSYRAYLDATYLLPQPWVASTGSGDPYGISGTPKDSTTSQYAPVYVDRFPARKVAAPIMYLRAHQGVVGTASNAQICTSDSGNLPAQYDNNQLKIYASVFPELGGPNPPNDRITKKQDYATWTAYFQDPNTGGASGVAAMAYHADTYLLFSAGFDGQFGTADDIRN